MQTLTEIRAALHQLANPRLAAAKQPFYQTQPGGYGEGDQFLGVTVPDTRSLLKNSDALSEADVLTLLHSAWHEERLLALLILVRRFAKAAPSQRDKLVKLYLANTKWINNWDLVDASAPGVLGVWLLDHDRSVLSRLAASKNLWEQRIAVVSTFTLIRSGQFEEILTLSKSLLKHPHDLMHKACGWMLREAGKRDERVLSRFLDQHATNMPRTMLRYAIEKFSPSMRKHYMKALQK
jgi:3-methyladenine DNA glycosylase AlkD